MLNINGELQKLRRQSAAWEMTQTTGDAKVRERNRILNIIVTQIWNTISTYRRQLSLVGREVNLELV